MCVCVWCGVGALWCVERVHTAAPLFLFCLSCGGCAVALAVIAWIEKGGVLVSFSG